VPDITPYLRGLSGDGGLRVKVVERRKVVAARGDGGIHPGFRNSVAAYTVSLLNPQIISDLKLSHHGLRIVERRAQNFLPSPDGRYLLTGEGRTYQSIAKLSTRDADRIDAFTRELEAIADVLRQFVLRAPPNIVEGFGVGSIREAFNALGTPTSCASFRWSSSAACSTCSRARPARCWTTGSRAIW